jgi:Tfp pilus assembly protein PilX
MKPIARQRGVALFFALICLVAIMMAAVILVRSVDTSTLIAGNLGFQQSATRSGDGGTETAIADLFTLQSCCLNSTKNVLLDPSHSFNVNSPTDPATGKVYGWYYASLDPSVCLTGTCTGTPPANPGGRTSYVNFDWTTAGALAADTTGNTVQYVIQRMCRTSGVSASTADCLYSGATQDNNGQNIPLPQDICNGPGCPAAGQTPEVRVTSRITGPKNTVSYVQAIIY